VIYLQDFGKISGHVRVKFHYFNTEEKVDTIIDAIKSIN
jgi:selenocysteine lyase/cysteine desulfurase